MISTAAQIGDDSAVSRRQVVRACGASVGSAAGLSALTGSVQAAHDGNSPSAVDDPVFDEQLLEKYKPQLITADLDVEPSSIHGFAVRSSKEPTTALAYWVEYPVQIDMSGFASHIGDHEPFYVFIRNEGTTDEYIERVVYSGYHWMAAESRDPPTVDGSDSSPPKTYVFPEYHHYSVAQARNDTRATASLTLKDLTSSLPRWLDDPDFHDALSSNWNGRGSPAYVPWIMYDKASWWRVSGLSNFEQSIRALWLWLGIRGADGSDLE